MIITDLNGRNDKYRVRHPSLLLSISIRLNIINPVKCQEFNYRQSSFSYFVQDLLN